MKKLVPILLVSLLIMSGCASIPRPAPVYAGGVIEAHRYKAGAAVSLVNIPDDATNGDMETVVGSTFVFFGVPLKFEVTAGEVEEPHIGLKVFVGGRVY